MHAFNQYGERYVINAQRGPVLLSRTAPGRAVYADCAIRLALRRFRSDPERAVALVRKLDGATGWWASHAMRLQYGRRWAEVVA